MHDNGGALIELGDASVATRGKLFCEFSDDTPVQSLASIEVLDSQSTHTKQNGTHEVPAN